MRYDLSSLTKQRVSIRLVLLLAFIAAPVSVNAGTVIGEDCQLIGTTTLIMIPSSPASGVPGPTISEVTRVDELPLVLVCIFGGTLFVTEGSPLGMCPGFRGDCEMA